MNMKKMMQKLLILPFIATLFSSCMAMVGAGVIPYTIKDSRVLILIGHDIHKGNFGWCDMGGGAKDKKNAKKSAAIEGHEETMGRFLNNTLDPQPEKNKDAGIKYFTDRCDDNWGVFAAGYQCYFVKVDFIESEEFIATRNELLQQNIAHHYLEKDDFAWVDAAEILENTKGIEAKDPREIRKSIGLTDAFDGRELQFLNRYFIFTLIQPQARTILKKLIGMAEAGVGGDKKKPKKSVEVEGDDIEMEDAGQDDAGDKKHPKKSSSKTKPSKSKSSSSSSSSSKPNPAKKQERPAGFVKPQANPKKAPKKVEEADDDAIMAALDADPALREKVLASLVKASRHNQLRLPELEDIQQPAKKKVRTSTKAIPKKDAKPAKQKKASIKGSGKKSRKKLTSTANKKRKEVDEESEEEESEEEATDEDGGCTIM